MRRLLIGLAMLFGAEGTALACSCVAPSRDPAEIRSMAEDMARSGVALVEVEVLSGYDARRNVGERMRVRRLIAGSAPRTFRVARRGQPQSSMCDNEYRRGERGVMLLVPDRSGRRRGGGERQFGDRGNCTTYLLQAPGYREALIDAFRRKAAGRLPAADAGRTSGMGLAGLACSRLAA